MSTASFNPNNSIETIPFREKYLCFQIYGKTSHVAQCNKSRALTKVIDSILDIESFEQKCVVLKWLLKLELLKSHTGTIGIDQELSNSALHEYRYL